MYDPHLLQHVSPNRGSPSSRFDWQPTPATFLPLPKCQPCSSVPHFCSVLFTLSRAKGSTQAAPARLVLLRQSLKNTQTWPVLDRCPGYRDRHALLLPCRQERRKKSELLHHLRFVASTKRGTILAFGLAFLNYYYCQKCRPSCFKLCKF